MNGYALGVNHHHGWLTCSACGYEVDASAEVGPTDPGNHLDDNPRPPADGDVSVCLSCASINVYVNRASAFRPPTADERADFARSATVQAAVQTVIETRDRAESWPRGGAS